MRPEAECRPVGVVWIQADGVPSGQMNVTSDQGGIRRPDKEVWWSPRLESESLSDCARALRSGLSIVGQIPTKYQQFQYVAETFRSVVNCSFDYERPQGRK